MQATDHERAVALHEALKFVNECRIPVMTREKVSQKEKAKLARQLFKQLGLKGISVRIATGAWCFHVDVGLPRMDHDYNHESRRCNPNCAGCAYRQKTHLAIEEILQRAFPREIDESDHMTDYYKPAWFIYF